MIWIHIAEITGAANAQYVIVETAPFKEDLIFQAQVLASAYAVGVTATPVAVANGSLGTLLGR